MSAGILKALMQLFAMIAGGSGNSESSDSGRDIVAIFLRQQLNKELVTKYLGVYDDFITQNQSKRTNKGDRQKKRTSLTAVKVLRICTRINEELAQKEKFFVLVRLLEFITSFETTSELDKEFVQTVAETFNISSNIYDNLLAFSEAKEDSQIENNEFLFVSGNQEENQDSRHILKDSFKGKLIFLRIENENMFLLRYFGNEDMLLNGQSMSNNLSYLFLQGASIRGAKISPIYYSDVISKFFDKSDKNRIVFRAENISYYFKRNNKQGLHQLNIIEDSGKLIGIMGASGSGKSTLLNVLNGNYHPTYGSVTINGVNIHTESDKIEGVLGYVAQDDLLIEELSVYQNLYYNAKLCFSKKTDDEISELVNDTLQSIGLFEAKDLIVGSPLEKTISGGQRKRLNIALELIREPSVLFVDEPTSGLSSRDSENIMDLLKELTLKGKLIFVVIHQPSSDLFKMFDKLFILDQGGYPIYYGNPVESIIYFKRLVNHVNLNESECPRCGNVNPEQIFNIIEAKIVDEYGLLTEHRKITPREWNNFFNVIIGNHINKKDKLLQTPESSFSLPSKLKQLYVFFTRDVLSKLSNKQYLLVNLLEAPALALILSYFIKYYDTDKGESARYIFRESENLPQYLFISVIVALFLGLSVSAEEIIKDQMILKREKFLNLSKGSYLVSKISIMFLLSMIQSLAYVLVGNTVLEIQGLWFSYWLVFFSTSCFANLLGLNISASFNSAKVIYILIPILIIPQLLFSGVIVKFDKLYPSFASQSGVPWIGNIMASRWAYEALAVNQFRNNEYEEKIFNHDRKCSYYNWKKDHWINRLRSKVVESRKLVKNGEEQGRLSYNLLVLNNEFEKEIKTVKGFKIEGLSSLNTSNVTLELLDEVDLSLDQLFEYYKQRYNNARKQLDVQMIELTSTKEKRDELLRLKDNYYNESLEEFVTNSNDMKKIVEYKNELVQKVDPIYAIPIHKSFFGTHFYAPSKPFLGKQISTLSANLIVIWGMILLLILILFFDGLRWVLEGITFLLEELKGLLTSKKSTSLEEVDK